MTRRSLILGAAGSAGMDAQSGVHVGSQTNAWPIDPKDPESLLAVLGTIKRLGFAGYETGFRNLQDHFARPESMRARLRQAGLRFFGIHVFLLQYDPETAIGPWDLLKAVADGGSALGAERLIVSGGSTPAADALARKAKALDRVAHYCHEKGMRFGYHNHDAEFKNNGAQIEELLRATEADRVHLIVDAGHALEGGANVAEFFSRHAARIDGIHLRDARQGKEVPLGQGDYQWNALAAGVAARKWQGWLLTEEERLSGEKPGEAAIQPARQAITRIFGV